MDFETKNNISITLRERGKLVHRYLGHNIWLKTGGAWLAKLVRDTGYYAQTSLADPKYDFRVEYFGFGLGGYRQTSPGNVPAVVWTDYPGLNEEIGFDPEVSALERPVRITGATGAPVATDYWLVQVQAPPIHPTPTSTLLQAVLGVSDVSYGPYTHVPLSEVGLYEQATAQTDSPGNNTPVAYHVFDTIEKTANFEMEISWLLKF